MSTTVKDLVMHYYKETRGNLNIPTIKSRHEFDLTLMRGLATSVFILQGIHQCKHVIR